MTRFFGHLLFQYFQTRHLGNPSGLNLFCDKIFVVVTLQVATEVDIDHLNIKKKIMTISKSSFEYR